MADAKKKVLIVDDDKTVHSILKLVLEKAGFQVFAALDSMQGIMLTKQLKPDLVILDIMMPAGGGFVVYERLQMMSGTFQVPFLIYSTMDRAQVLKKIPESAQVKVFSKTTPLERIVEAAKELTGV